MFAGVSREQIKRAKEIKIEDYILSHEPQNVKRVGYALYLKDHNSLEISNGLWNWHSQGIGGNNVVDYLIKVRGYGFVDAVRRLAGSEFSLRENALLEHRTLHPAADEIIVTRTITPKPRPPTVENPAAEREPGRMGEQDAKRPTSPFKLPRRHEDNNRVIEYLRNRGIEEKLIRECIRQNILYESADFHNAVFVGRDESGKARFAALRGTVGDFKRDANGSDKRYGFCLPHNGGNRSVAVYESPIDLLSHAVIDPDYSGYRLSLGGTALAALTHFLETHREIESITVCTDNDAAGNLAAQKIAELQTYTVTRQIPDNGAKDWNDALISIRNEVIMLEDKRKDILFLAEPFKYPEAFRIKDGDSVKVTYAFDGEVATQKCRFIDETHLYVGNNAYHISELAERLKKNGDTVEPIPGQKPKLDILAAKYGENLKDVEIPMTEAALKKLVGGKYDVTPLRYYHGQVFGALVSGKDGIAVCGMTDGVLTSLHPYNAQSQKRELSPAAPPKKPSILGGLEEAKAEAAAHNAAGKSAERPKNRAKQEV